MRPCSAATAALLANPPPGLKSADLFTFMLRDGVTTYRWTSYDRDLTVNGNTYSSRNPWLERSRWDMSNTMQVPTLEVYLRALNDGFAGGIDIKGQITNGLFDGAAMTFDRVLFDLGAIPPSSPTVPPAFFAGFSGLSWLLPCTGFFSSNTCHCSAGSSSSFTLTGVAGTLYTVQVRIRGVVELNPYTGGIPLSPSYVVENPTSYQSVPAVNTYKLLVSDPPAAYYLNNGVFVSSDCTPLDYVLSFPARGNATLTLVSDSHDGLEVKNIGNHSVADDNLLQPVVVTQPYDGQFMQLDATAAVTIDPGVRLFGGNVANIDITGNSAIINIRGKTNLLNQDAPRNLYQLGCGHAFCDVGCTLARATFTSSHTVGSGSGGPTRTFIPWNGAAPGNAANFRYGTVTFTSGPCSGQSRTVRLGDSTGLTLTQPLLGTPVAGNSFTSFEGCDKQYSSGSGQDCTARSNTQNWRAFPFVPPADSAA